MACTDSSAYVSLLTVHENKAGEWKTFLAKHAKSGLITQVKLLRSLLRSLRRVELCRRDFVLLLGTAVQLPPAAEETLRGEGVIFHRVPPLKQGVPTLDKLHAWRLVSYSALLFIDADAMALQPLDQLFADQELVIAAHPYDMMQGACDLPLGRRAVTGLFMLRPSVAMCDACQGGPAPEVRPPSPAGHRSGLSSTAHTHHF